MAGDYNVSFDFATAARTVCSFACSQRSVASTAFMRKM